MLVQVNVHSHVVGHVRILVDLLVLAHVVDVQVVQYHVVLGVALDVHHAPLNVLVVVKHAVRVLQVVDLVVQVVHQHV